MSETAGYITITTDDYEALLTDAIKYDLLLNILLKYMEIDFGDKAYIPGTETTKTIKGFAPALFEEREAEVRKERGNA